MNYQFDKLKKRLINRKVWRLNGSVLYFDAGVLQVVLEHIIQEQSIDVKKAHTILQFIQKVLRIKIDEVWIFTDDIKNIIDRELSRSPRRYPHLSKRQLQVRYKLAQNFIEIIKNKYNYKIKLIKANNHDKKDIKNNN